MGKRGRPYHRIHRKSSYAKRESVALKTTERPPDRGDARELALLIVFWGYVLVPLAWGVYSTLQKALLLFR